MPSGRKPPFRLDQIGRRRRGENSWTGYDGPWLSRTLVVNGGDNLSIDTKEVTAPLTYGHGRRGACGHGAIELDRVSQHKGCDPNSRDPDAGLGRLAAVAEAVTVVLAE